MVGTASCPDAKRAYEAMESHAAAVALDLAIVNNQLANAETGNEGKGDLMYTPIVGLSREGSRAGSGEPKRCLYRARRAHPSPKIRSESQQHGSFPASGSGSIESG